MFNSFKQGLISVWELTKGLGKTLKGALTFKWDTFTEGLSDMKTAVVNSYKKMGTDVVDNWNKQFDGIGERTANKLIISDEVAKEIVESYDNIGKGIEEIDNKITDTKIKNLKKEEKE